VTRLRVRDIYASEGIVAALLELLACERYLDHDGRGAYALAVDGRATLARIRERRHGLLAGLEPLPAEEVTRIAAWLDLLIDACLRSGTPPGTWCLAHSRNRAPGAESGPLIRIVQYLDDMNAFRDDAHMAAWQPLGVGGHAWEAFAIVCAGAADSAEAVFATLTHRGYPRSAYATALDGLARRGWLAADSDGRYTVTPDGRAVREAVERRTDEYFYAPWSCLETREVEALHA